MKSKAVFFSILVCLTSFVYGQLTVKVTSIPTHTPDWASIYIAGTMNNWNPKANGYLLTKNSDQTYSITFTPAQGTVKFKFTRGSWDTVEGTAQGGFIPDRTTTYSGSPKTIELSIAGWEGQSNTASTASPQVKILSDTFTMKSLNRKRRIWLYLPSDYTSSSKSYPVLYAHDGQNLFDKKTSFAGEWGIDEALDSMFLKGDYGAIVVGIDNGGSQRLNEYSPWTNAQYGGGQGEQYVDFIVKELKPYIDQNYRTFSGPEYTGIVGSSMGGLISYYAGLKYPEVFGRVGALSSSYWFSSSSYDYPKQKKPSAETYIYMIAGDKEGGNQTGDMNKMYQILLQEGMQTKQIYKQNHADGTHSEWYWRREFPKMYQWLFEKKTVNLTNEITNNRFSAYQQGNFLIIKTPKAFINEKISLFDMNGKLIIQTPFASSLDLSHWGITSGIYVVRIGNETVKIHWTDY
jgi:predicted alpha/beta superfamily hydrolase